MKHKYKRVKYWCYGCDRFMVENGMKCPVCGNKYGVKIKKPNKDDIYKEVMKEY